MLQRTTCFNLGEFIQSWTNWDYIGILDIGVRLFSDFECSDMNTDIFESLTLRWLSSFLDMWLALLQRSRWMHFWLDLETLECESFCIWVEFLPAHLFSQLLLTIFESVGDNGDFVLSVFHFTSCSHQGHSPDCKWCWTITSDSCRHRLLISSSVFSKNGVWNSSILVNTV